MSRWCLLLVCWFAVCAGSSATFAGGGGGGRRQSQVDSYAQIHMPRMPRKELEGIVEHGLSEAGMKIEPYSLAEITGLSKGLPHYTHLLALHASRKALDAKQLRITAAHVKEAVQAAMGEAQESIRHDYDRATYSSRKDTLHSAVLLACAVAETDDYGRFQPTDVCDPLEGILGRKPFTTESSPVT